MYFCSFQDADKLYECGVLNVKACYNAKSELLEVYIMNAANVLPLDSSGKLYLVWKFENKL